MSSKVITWIALGLSVIALGVAGYFFISSQAATRATPPCTIGEDPNCGNNSLFPLLEAGNKSNTNNTSNNTTNNTGSTDLSEIGTCFTNFKPLPVPPPENPDYRFYVDTFGTCLQDETAYAFCVDENATTPDNCEYLDRQ
ncbi:MAG: hypothetical protein U0517_02335 [Candidatus Andersenbacteria bacterium]